MHAPAVAAEEAPTFAGYVGALRKHIWLVLAAGALGFALSAAIASRAEPVYVSVATMQIADQRGGGASSGLAGLAASLGGGGGTIATQIQVIRSRLLLGQVVDSLGLRVQRPVQTAIRTEYHPTGVVSEVHVDSTATADHLELAFDEDSVRVEAAGETVTVAYGVPISIKGVHFVVPSRPAEATLTLRVMSRDGAIDTLLGDVNVSGREGSSLLDVTASAYDPVVSERIANGLATAFRAYTTAKAREQAVKQRRFLEEQLATTEGLLRQTQDELTQYRKREGLYSSKAQATAEQAGALELQMKRAEIEAQRNIYRSVLAEAESAKGRRSSESLQRLIAAPGVGENPMVVSQYSQLNQLQAARDSLLAGPWGKSASDPDIQRIDSLMVISQGRLLSAARSHAEALDAQVAAFDMVQSRMAGAMQHLAGSEPEELRLILRMEAIGDAVTELRNRYYTAGMAEEGTVDQVTILDRALPGGRSGPGPFRSIILGLIFGLMVGGAGAIGLETANRSFRRRGEVERQLLVPGLAVIPPIPAATSRRMAPWLPIRSLGGSAARRGDGALGEELVAATRIHSVGAEAYRTLRTNLMFSQAGRELKSLVITSPSGGEGKTTTAANLAVTFAQQGLRVLLIDCDIRRPRVHSLFGLPKEPGLTHLLQGDLAVEQVIRSTAVSGLTVIAAGGVPSVSATDLLSGSVLHELLTALGEDHDLVILDAPPVLVAANAAVLGTAADGVLLVVRAGRTDPLTAREAIHQLAVVGGKVVGAVLNDPDATVPRKPSTYHDEALTSA